MDPNTPPEPTPTEDKAASVTKPGTVVASGEAAQPSWLKRHWKLITVAGILVVALAGGAAAFVLTKPSSKTAVTPVKQSLPTPVPTPVTKLSPLTGLPMDPALADRPVSSVIIENHPDARPQSGLSQAGVVYEALAEGGITRFQAFFLDQQPAAIGPVRSLRTYFVDWGLEFNAPVAHAGGNADAMDLVAPLKMKDLNALSFAQNAFYRTTDRYAPHNLYTSTAKMDALLKQFGFSAPSSFEVSPRKADAATGTSAPHGAIHINYSYNGYQVDYAYDAAANDYARSLAGASHIDRNSGAQIHVKNVVVEYMPTSYGYTRTQEQTVIMQTVGQGKALVFRDGDVVLGTWSKASHAARTKLTDSAGKDIPLDAGNTWYSIVPATGLVTY